MNTPLVILAGMPWWVGLAVAVVVHTGVRWRLPSLWAHNQILHPIATALSNIAWLVALPFVVVAGLSALGSSDRRRLLDAQRDLDTLKALSWQDFERLVGEAYRRQGYVVEEVGGSTPDGGIDRVLHRTKRPADAAVPATPSCPQCRGTLSSDCGTAWAEPPSAIARSSACGLQLS